MTGVPLGAGERAVVTQYWVYDCPYCSDVLTGEAGDEFEVSAYIPAKQAEAGFAFYRGTVTLEGKVQEYLCPADKCERTHA